MISFEEEEEEEEGEDGEEKREEDTDEEVMETLSPMIFPSVEIIDDEEEGEGKEDDEREGEGAICLYQRSFFLLLTAPYFIFSFSLKTSCLLFSKSSNLSTSQTAITPIIKLINLDIINL